MRWLSPFTPLLLVCVLSTAPVWASPVEGAKGVLKRATDAIVEAAQGAETQAQMRARVDVIMQALVDFERFSARTMGTRWGGLSERQRQRFVAAFRSLVGSTYGKHFKPGLSFRVSERGQGPPSPGGGRVIKTTLHGARSAVDVDYHFELRTLAQGRTWRVVDIEIDGVSMSDTWRSQFIKVFDRDGYDVLISKIEKKARRR